MEAAVGKPHAAPSDGPPLILDTDIGDDIDDTWALAYLLSRSADIKLIVTAYGDRERHLQRCRIIKKILRSAGRDVPVALGCESWGRQGAHRPNCGQAGWAQDCDVDGVIEDGVEAMAEVLRSSKVPVTVLGIAPLCNIGALIARTGEGIVQGHNFVGMHGSIYRGYGGRKEPIAEHNVACDPAAASVTLQAPWARITLCPLDTCGVVRLGGAAYQAVLNSKSELAKAVISTYTAWAKVSNVVGHYKTLDPEAESTVLFDTAAAELAASPDGLMCGLIAWIDCVARWWGDGARNA